MIPGGDDFQEFSKRRIFSRFFGRMIPVELLCNQSFDDFPISVVQTVDMQKPGCRGQIGFLLMICILESFYICFDEELSNPDK